MKFMRSTGALGAALLVTACGGGGGDAPPPRVEVPAGVRSVAASAGSDLNAGNFQASAGTLARVVMGATGNSLVGDGIAGSREQPLAAATSAARWLGGWQSWVSMASRGMAPSSTRERPAATGTVTEPCPAGGTLTVFVDDADNNAKLSAGDRLGFTAANCRFDTVTPPANGSFELTVNVVELDANDEPTAIDASGRFVAFGIGTVASLDGSFRLWSRPESATSERMRISYGNVTATRLNETVVYNVDIYAVVTATGGAYAVDGGLGIGGQVYSVVQGDVFAVNAAGVPSSGSLRLRDAAGDAVLLRARSAVKVDFDFTPAGSVVPTLQWLDRDWSEFAL